MQEVIKTNLTDLYSNKVSYYDEIKSGTLVYVGNGIDKWIITKDDHHIPVLMKVIKILNCGKCLTDSSECTECKIKKVYTLSFCNNTVPFSNMCSKVIYDIRGRQYEMR
jgi:hypothetical protein